MSTPPPPLGLSSYLDNFIYFDPTQVHFADNEKEKAALKESGSGESRVVPIIPPHIQAKINTCQGKTPPLSSSTKSLKERLDEGYEALNNAMSVYQKNFGTSTGDSTNSSKPMLPNTNGSDIVEENKSL